MKRKLVYPILALIGLLFLNKEQLNAQNSSSPAKITWLTWNQAQELNKKNPKPIFIDIYTDWCGWCKRMDATTFEDKEVVKYMNEKFYAVKFNAEQKEEIIWNGNSFQFVNNSGRGVHTLAYSLLDGRLGYPSMVIFNDKMERALVSPGYKDVDNMLAEMEFVAEGHYKKMKLEEYKKM